MQFRFRCLGLAQFRFRFRFKHIRYRARSNTVLIVGWPSLRTHYMIKPPQWHSNRPCSTYLIKISTRPHRALLTKPSRGSTISNAYRLLSRNVWASRSLKKKKKKKCKLWRFERIKKGMWEFFHFDSNWSNKRINKSCSKKSKIIRILGIANYNYKLRSAKKKKQTLKNREDRERNLAIFSLRFKKISQLSHSFSLLHRELDKG